MFFQNIKVKSSHFDHYIGLYKKLLKYKFIQTTKDCNDHGTRKNVAAFDKEAVPKFWKMVNDPTKI